VVSREAYAPAYSHEQIGSFCANSPSFGGEKGAEAAEREWAQSEVGEGVEEVWERAVS
jgi:ribonuclease T2